METGQAMEQPYEVRISEELRRSIEKEKSKLMDFINHLKSAERKVRENEDVGEQIANAMLAYRHLEDAKMRVGKVIQATVGASIYDQGAK